MGGIKNKRSGTALGDIGMEIYLMRHGEAESKREGTTDDARRLTKHGEDQVRKNLAFAKENLGARIDLILSSPLTRAKQTANIAADLFAVKQSSVDGSLAPESAPYEIYAALSKIDPSFSKSVLLVTHQPLVSHLLEDLVRSSRIAMSPASLAKITTTTEGEPRSQAGTLIWLLP